MTDKAKHINEDLAQQRYKIGRWEAPAFTLHTAILLEQIESPFMKLVTDADGNAVPQIPTLSEIAQALYIVLNADKPWIHEVLADATRFANEVGQLTSQITLRDFGTITGELNAMMTQLNSAVTESGLDSGEKKSDATGHINSLTPASPDTAVDSHPMP